MFKSKINNDTVLLFLFLVFISVIYLFDYYKFIGLFYDDIRDSGAFGDSFGALNSLFSGLALLGVLYTVILQKRELSLQREELRKSVDAQKEQVSELKKSAKISALTTLADYALNRPAEKKTHTWFQYHSSSDVGISIPAIDLDPEEQKRLEAERYIGPLRKILEEDGVI